MKTIETLVEDIYARLASPEPFDEKLVETFAHNLAKKLANRLAEEKQNTKLRLSNWDTKCERQLWLKINKPETVEELPPHVRLKFLMGDIAEEVIFFLAVAAGHNVEGEQDTLNLAGVEGHRDGIIDGHLVDAKSASPYGFKKFEGHALQSDDPFGYLGQLGSYLAASIDDPRLHDKTRASFVAIDKVSGKLCVDTYDFPVEGQSRGMANGDRLSVDIEAKKGMLSGPCPNKAYGDEEDGKSGNRKLGLACSYCPVKSACWDNLRAFAYSNGPRFLTKVVKLPEVPEFDPKGEGPVGSD